MSKTQLVNKSDYDLVNDTILPKKMMASNISDYIAKHVTDKTFIRMKECNTFMQLISTSDKKNKKQISGNSCKNRFCPICNWRKSRKDSMAISIMMQAIKQDTEYNYLFLTLTVPNVDSDELDSKINEMNQAFNLYMKYKQINKAVNGYVRKLEITYNESENTYHPHIHAIIAVDKTYFKNTRKYLKHADWLALWKQAMRDDSIQFVNIQRVKTESKNKAFLEIAKYSAKDTDLLKSQDTFDTLYTALKGKRLLSYSGIFKEYNKRYKDGLLNAYKNLDTNEYIYLVTAQFNQNKYEQVYELLTDEQKALFNKHLIDETDLRD